MHRWACRALKGRTPLGALCIIDLTEIEHLALDQATACAHALDDAPVTMLLAILKTLMTLQVHGSIFAGNHPASMGRVCPTSHLGNQPTEIIKKTAWRAAKKVDFSDE
jgi:hypothetical protein